MSDKLHRIMSKDSNSRSTVGPLLDGLVFPEGPRWHEGKLWFSDMHGHRVITIDLAGQAKTVAEFDDKPSGLGFLPDGTPLAVSMRKRLVVSLHDGGYSTYVDLAHIPGESINDMVVDGAGRAYVGNRTEARELATPFVEGKAGHDNLVAIFPDRTARVVADGVWRPNGMGVTPDGRTLIVSEPPAKRLTAFTIANDGSLSDRRVFAVLSSPADGICLDAEGAVWIGCATIGEFVRVREGGEVVQRYKVPEGKWAIACVLGGPDRQTLFMCTAHQTHENLDKLRDFQSDLKSNSKGFIETMRVGVPGAGWP